MTRNFTFAEVSNISSISLLEEKLESKQYCSLEIKHTSLALKEFAALSVQYWYIKELRIIFEEVATVFVQYCCLYQLLTN